jgi:hypothetical protein
MEDVERDQADQDAERDDEPEKKELLLPVEVQSKVKVGLLILTHPQMKLPKSQMKANS